MAKPYFRVHRNQLFPALAAVFEAVERKATIPILANVLLQPRSADLLLRGTDLDIEIEASCELLEEGNGETVTLLGEDLMKIVKGLPETAEIEFAPGAYNGQVLIRSGKSRFTLLSLPSGDFPSIADKVKGDTFPISMSVLADACNRVLYAVGVTDAARIFLQGICLKPYMSGAKIAVAGCDGHNLAVVRIGTNEPVNFPTVIIPVQMINAMCKLVGKSKSTAIFTISESLIRLECDGLTIISKLIDAQYPEYERLIPSANEKEVIAPVANLSAAVDRVCIVANDVAKDVVKLTLDGGSIKLQLATLEGEEAYEEIAADCFGDSIEIGFNGRYLKGMLGSIQTQDVAMYFSDGGTAGLFKPTIESDELYIIMPKRV
ncbi:DNA polymerase III subunit beta [Rhizobium sp. CNPSo 4062]|uniref:DNA polymerase III subunit beta n=1 Tax=Rhizobium sp. CNPSo 4062 TaxID=3021410 RepID=UPI00254EE66B|nr:DNA polymerase III subunit beta [Rhizobium sp. CNPSo 4062]MDK4704300.1 DNA polymerase III subunit beta [Rhizobium sp. CNPSo 4062]